MNPVFKLFVDICLLRANAEDVPASRFLMSVSLTSYTLLILLIAILDHSLRPYAFLITLIDVGMLLGLAFAGLWIRSYMNRFQQTVTALAGSGIVFNLMNLPFLIWSSNLPNDQLTLPGFAQLLVLIWLVTVIGHIVRNAFSIPMWAGIGISLFYIFTYFRIIRFIFLVNS